MALGAMPPADPLFMGMLGMHAAKGTNLLLEEADLLFAIGSRFDDRATGKVADFCPRAAVAHIDIDPAEIGKIKPAFLGLVGDAADILAPPARPPAPAGPSGLAGAGGRLRTPIRCRPRRAPTIRCTRSTSAVSSARSCRPTRSSPPTSASTRCGSPRPIPSAGRARC